MSRVGNLFLLHVSIMIFSFTGIFSKLASGAWNEGGLTNPMVYVFLALMLLNCGVYALAWQRVIKHFDLSFAYANRSVYLLWSQLWAVAIFGEHLSVRNILGMLIVLIGVIVVSLSAKQEEE